MKMHEYRKKTGLSLSVIICALLFPPMTTAKSYYVNNIAGNDLLAGQSENTAWKTLEKVNATTFLPNDTIRFKANGVWVGQLFPKGSGASGAPIVIDYYGIGSKPLIDGNGMTGTGVVYLYNQAYWEINNLEVVNDGSDGADRRGVRVEVSEGAGVINHIYLRNLHIHNIKGLVGQYRSNKRTSGIGFGILSAKNSETRFNDILVENCSIHDCENQGIITECVDGDGFQPGTAEWNKMRITNGRIRNNTVYNISKNAMIIRLFDRGVVENNVCYNTANGITGNTIFSASCDSTIFQFNEGYLNNSPDYDGCLYDADLRSPNTIWQYSYSHDNSHGLFWTCTVQEDANVICRYNISQNDKGQIFCVNYPVTSIAIYNNTIYIPQHLSPVIIAERNGKEGTRTYSFRNNIIYNNSPTATYSWSKTDYTRIIENNCFYGIHPSKEPGDSKKITANPKFVNAGSGSVGLHTVDGYQLMPNSPCIDAGIEIENNGGRDYWGNLLYNGKPDIGAHEYYNTTSLSNISSDGIDFRLSSNPFYLGNELSFFLESNRADVINVNIFSQDGKQIFNKIFTQNANIYSLGCPFDHSGVFLVTVDFGKITLSKKIIVI